MKGEMALFIENLKKEIIALKKEKEQNDLRQRAKKSLFGQVSVERLKDKNEELTSFASSLKEELLKVKQKNAELQKLVDGFDAGVYR